MEKPKILYRGIKLDFDRLKDFDFSDEIGLPINFKYREDGMKLVSDGNEYGIYMTDNYLMTRSAYGDSSIYDGQYIDASIWFGMGRESLKIPPVCIIYEINTENIEIKEPWIDPKFQGHYNNGFQGKEWIAQKPIPRKNYGYKMIKIGADYLHPEEKIEFEKDEDIKKILIEKYCERNKRLLAFSNALKTMTPLERARMDLYIDLMIEIFQEGGIAYKKPSEIKVTDSKSLRDKLILKQINRGFNYKSIRDIHHMCSGLDDEHLYKSLIENLKRESTRNIAMLGIEEFISDSLVDIGATYCHFSNGNAQVLINGYDIKMSLDGDIEISKFGEKINFEDLIISKSCESREIEAVVGLLEDVRSLRNGSLLKDNINLEEQR